MVLKFESREPDFSFHDRQKIFRLPASLWLNCPNQTRILAPTDGDPRDFIINVSDALGRKFNGKFSIGN
jgi:hypothetical protein